MDELNLRQYVIVPRKPKMSPGKIASQVAHATFMALENEDRKKKEDWKEKGMPVMVLQCENETKLMGIAKYCEQSGIIHHIYIDEGITEIPMGTHTAMATGILSEEESWPFKNMELF